MSWSMFHMGSVNPAVVQVGTPAGTAGRPEADRATALLAAEAKAVELFDEVERRGLIAAGRRDREVSDLIRDLAGEMFGVRRFWHKRIVRSGPHTLRPYRENPPDRVIEPDD